VADLAHYLKQTPLAEGSNAIYYPGELEHTCAVQRERDGIAVEDATWAKLVTLAQGYGLAQELGLG